MQMTSSEIVSSYRQSLNHREQITILADLNSCAPATIVEVLKQAGVELPSGFKPPKYHPIPQAQYRIDELRAMELYKDGLSDRDIAEQLGCTRTGVANWRKRMHLKAHYPKRTPRKPGQMSLPGSPKEETPPDAVVVPEARPSAVPDTDVGDNAVSDHHLSAIDVSVLANILRTMADTAPSTAVIVDGFPVIRLEITSGPDKSFALRLITDRGCGHGAG